MPAANALNSMHGSRSEQVIGTSSRNRDQPDFNVSMRTSYSMETGMSDSSYGFYPEQQRNIPYEDSLDGEIMEIEENEEHKELEPPTRDQEEDSDPDYIPDNKSEGGRSSRSSARIKARATINKKTSKKEQPKVQETTVKKAPAKRGRPKTVIKEEIDSDYFEAGTES